MGNPTEYRCLDCGETFSRRSEGLYCPSCKVEEHVVENENVPDDYSPTLENDDSENNNGNTPLRYVIGLTYATIQFFAYLTNGLASATGAAIGGFIAIIILAVIHTAIKNRFVNRFDIEEANGALTKVDLLLVIGYIGFSISIILVGDVFIG